MPLAPHSKGAAWAALFHPPGDAATGPLRLPSLNGTRAPAAAYRGFRSHRLRGTAHVRRNHIGRHRAHHWTHLIRAGT